MTLDATRLDGWAPIRVYPEAGQLRVDWCHLGDTRFHEPFFNDTIERRLRHPFALLFRHQTSFDVLLERRAHRPGLPVRGLIFHMSRCGSTLVSQMLAALPWCRVLSEAGPIDSVLRAHLTLPGVDDETRISWLRAVVAALGQPGHPEERALFLKLDAWNTLELPLLQRAFPGVPWVFLYREPVEVMASHLNHRGAHMLPGLLEPVPPGLAPLDASGMTLEEYGARVLARICQAGLEGYEARTNPARLVSYRQLPDVVPELLAGHFGQDVTPEDLERMRAAGQRDAKNPVASFEDDSAQKALRVTPLARELAERLILPVHDALEAARRR
jgi:gluconate kinase